MFARSRPIALSGTSRASNCLRPALTSRFFSDNHLSPESKLDHIDLAPCGPKLYTQVEQLQHQLRTEHLNYKSFGEDLELQRPRPKLITFESRPTITLGRRQEPPSGKPELARLLQPVDVIFNGENLASRYEVEYTKSSRGGLTTYHGPGQLVCWPVIDMTSPEYPRYTVSSYAEHLQTVTQALLYRLFGIETFTTSEEPGVWVRGSDGQALKIAALGVHHRRHVTSYGIAINIDIRVRGPENENVWSRFVPCGLEGKGVTSVKDLVGSRIGTYKVPDIALIWASSFEKGLLDASERT